MVGRYLKAKLPQNTSNGPLFADFCSLVLATGGLFHLLENQRPLEDIDRAKHLKFDIIVVVISALMVAGLTVWLLDGL